MAKITTKEKVISLRVTEDMNNRVEVLANEFGLTPSAVLYQLLEAILYADELDEKKFLEFSRNAEGVFFLIEKDAAILRKLASGYRKVSVFLDDIQYAFNEIIKKRRKFEEMLKTEEKEVQNGS